jgi:hypothetical protein
MRRTPTILRPGSVLLPRTCRGRTTPVPQIHVGGGVRDDRGHYVNFERQGFQLGGEWCTGERLGMGPMGPMGPHAHLNDPGWQHPNGTYGMLFTFTTAG